MFAATLLPETPNKQGVPIKSWLKTYLTYLTGMKQSSVLFRTQGRFWYVSGLFPTSSPKKEKNKKNMYSHQRTSLFTFPYVIVGDIYIYTTAFQRLNFVYAFHEKLYFTPWPPDTAGHGVDTLTSPFSTSTSADQVISSSRSWRGSKPRMQAENNNIPYTY